MIRHLQCEQETCGNQVIQGTDKKEAEKKRSERSCLSGGNL